MKMHERIRQLRQENNFTPEEVAEYLEISQEHLSWIEEGRKNIDTTLLDKICLLYDCSPDYILARNDQQTTPKLPYTAEQKIDLTVISKLNQVRRHLELLRQIEEEVTQ